MQIYRDTGRKDKSVESLKTCTLHGILHGSEGCIKRKKAVATEGYELTGTVVENDSEAKAHKNWCQTVNIRKWNKKTTIMDINKGLTMKTPSFMDVLCYLIKMKFISKESELSSGNLF